MERLSGNVLIVDDDRLEHLLIRKMFAKFTGEVELHTAYTLEEARHLMTFNSYACALVDLGLPDGSGMELLTKEDDTPLIVMTQHQEEAYELEAMRNGAQDYLVKGNFGPSQLRRSLRYAIERKKLLVELIRSHELLRESYSKLEEMALADPLTGLSNRRALTNRLNTLIKEAHRGREFALVMLDLDHFKSLNDTHGHATGDSVLREVADYLTANARAVDCVARYGGEEFAILLVDVSEETASAVVRRICAQMPHHITQPRPITASFGMAQFDPEGMDSDTLFEAADAALYQAKRSGRNCVRRHCSKCVFKATG